MSMHASPNSREANSSAHDESPASEHPQVELSPDSRAWTRDLVGVLVCVLLGILFAVLPYLLWWNSLDGPYFIADYDETFYLAIAGQAYHNHPWSISDPATTEPQPSHYPVLQFALLSCSRRPFTWARRA